MAGKPTSLKQLPAHRFAELGGFFGGPTVTIYVGPEDIKQRYVLSKGLLCSLSSYFKGAFEGHFKESQEQVLHLDEDSPEDFELVIQWIYTDNVVLPLGDPAIARVEVLQENITRYLGCIMLCDKLLLQGDCTDVIKAMRACLIADRKALLPQHVRRSVSLKPGHPIRRLFAAASAPYYLDATAPHSTTFWLAKEVKELNGFAQDLLQVCREIWRSCHCDRGKYSTVITWVDPLTKQDLSASRFEDGTLALVASLPS